MPRRVFLKPILDGAVMRNLPFFLFRRREKVAVLVAFLWFWSVSDAGAQWSEGLENARIADLPAANVTEIIRTLANWLLSVLGLLAVVGFVLAGMLFLLAGGNEDRIGQAKRALMYSIIGVFVALAGFVAVRAVDTLLRGQAL
jgi:hypothetical protein